MQIQPQESFIITRQIDDPTDTNTYYVRAFVRNAKTDALLATVNLTDKGNQRFRGEWQVNADITGQGYYVTITTHVYTDSSYTTESQDYRILENQYLVKERNQSFGGGGFAGTIKGEKIDYNKIKELLRVVVKEEIQTIKPTEKIDLSPILSQIRVVIKAISGIKPTKIPEFPKIEFPKQKEVDFNPLIKEFKNIDEKLSLVKNSDLTPIIDYLNHLKKLIEVKTEEQFKQIQQEQPEIKLIPKREFIKVIGEIKKRNFIFSK